MSRLKKHRKIEVHLSKELYQKLSDKMKVDGYATLSESVRALIRNYVEAQGARSDTRAS
ncbi:MAG: hypothetical protein V1915_02840 [Candidatus Bathyarchaeota archaeon]